MRAGRLLLLALAACKRGDSVSPPATGVGWDGGLVLVRDGQTLLRFPDDGFELGTVDAYDPGASYDPVWTPPVAWHAVTSASIAELPGGDLAVSLSYDAGIRAELTVHQDGPGRFSANWTPSADADAAVFRLRPQIDATEGIYGLGEVLDTPDHRGKVRALQLEVDPALESLYNEAHVPVPLAIGTDGWGLFVEDRHPMQVDAAAAEADRLDWQVGAGPDAAAGLKFHLYEADHPLDVTRLYYADTASPTLPDPWALGPLLWRDEDADQAELEADLQLDRDLDLPASGTWLDRPYATGVNTFDFDPAKFPDPTGMIAYAHQLGFRVGAWHTPYVSADESPELNQEAADDGYFPPSTSLLLNGWGVPIDFSNPAAAAWWGSLVERYTSMGIEGFKLDYGEDVVVGAAGGVTAWRFADGTDARTMHKVYPLLYHRAYAEELPVSGGFLLCRASTWGDQANARVIWPGDLDASLARSGDEVVDSDGSTYVAVGGLPASVVAGLSLGPSGFPFFGSDTGGYRHSPPDTETFVRWFEQTALSTVMEVGNSASLQPWELLTDGAQLGWYRDAARLHLRLFPYVWSYAQMLAVDGRPIERPVGLAFPELRGAPPEEYLLGDWLLVAPVVDAGATTKDVVFPPGRWIDWFTGEVRDRDATVDAPLEKLPLYLAEGGIVPLLREGIDTIREGSAGVDGFAGDPGVLTVRIFPGPSSRFDLYDGTAITQASSDGVSIGLTPGSVFDSGMVLEIVGVEAPTSVTVDGVATDWTFEGGIARVDVPAGPHAVRLR